MIPHSLGINDNSASILPSLDVVWHWVADGFGPVLWQLNEGKCGQRQKTDCWQVDMYLVSLSELDIANESPRVLPAIVRLAVTHTHRIKQHQVHV